MTTESTTQSSTKPAKPNGKQPRVITHPGEIAGLVMMQIDNVNSKKDELTMAIKALSDTTKQLARAYAQQTAAIAKLQKRVKELEEKASGT